MDPQSPTPATVFDWARAHARIEDAIAAIESSTKPPPGDVRRILRERAERYAKPPFRSSDAAVLDIIVFRLGALRFGIEVSQGSAVTSITGLSHVPGLSVLYMGVLSHRGAIYPIVRLERLLSGGYQQDQVCRYAVLMRHEGGALGLGVEDVLGISRFSHQAIALTPHESRSNRIVYGVTPDSITIIDVAQLMMDARLVIDDQPSLPAVTQRSLTDVHL